MNRKIINIIVTIAIIAIIVLLVFIIVKYPLLFIIPGTIYVVVAVFYIIYICVDDWLWRSK